MRELSLFSGAGGGLLGTYLLGWRPVGYVEIDDYCQRVLAARIRDGILPDAPIFGDIKAFVRDGYAASYTGLVDLISAGFPCQPFSLAGRRRGEMDERNMWPATRDVLRIVRPQWVFLENVPGLLATQYFGTILADLAEAGFDARWEIISAVEVGAPHLRNRLWLVANATSERREKGREPQRGESTKWFAGGGEEASDAYEKRRQNGDDLRGREHETERSGWWAIEPGICRVVNGLACRVDRLKATGNGQVPAVVAEAWERMTR